MRAFTLARRRLPISRSIVNFAHTRGYVAQSPPGLSEGEQAIFIKLTQKFSPNELAVQDVSGGCGTFYAISISSEAFKGLPTVKQHRLVNEALKKEIEGIHGLQLRTSVPPST